MRVTNTMMANNMMRNLNRNLNRMEYLQQQMSSGKKFTRPSDDPIGVSRSLRLHTEIANMEQYKRNADDAQSWMDTTEMAINNIATILQRAGELTMAASTETNSIDERKAIANEIKELRNQLIQIGNTTYAGSYIFSGFKTDKPLLTAEGSYDIGGTGAKLTLDEVIETNIGLGDKTGMNSVGQRIFGLSTGAAGELDSMTVDTLTQKQSLKGKYLDLTANPINAPAPGLNFTITNGTATQVVNITGSYNNLGALASAIESELDGTPFDEPNVNITVENNKLIFDSNTAITVKSGTVTPTDPVFDVARMGMTNNQTSVSRVNSGDDSQLIAIFDQLYNDLTSGTNGDTDGIRSAIGRIEKQAANINAIRAEIGVKTNRIELTTNRILDDTLNLNGLLSKNEDADMAEVIMNLKMEENVYQASLATGAKIIQPSLIDFLR